MRLVVTLLLYCSAMLSVYSMGWLEARISVSKHVFGPWLDRLHNNDPHGALRLNDWKEAWTAYEKIPRPFPVCYMDWLARRVIRLCNRMGFLKKFQHPDDETA